MKPFKEKDGIPQEPRINVTEIINEMRKKPGNLMIEEHQVRGKSSICKSKLNPYADKDKLFEFNAFAELIIFAIIETRVKYREQLIAERDERIRLRLAAEAAEEQARKRGLGLVTGEVKMQTVTSEGTESVDHTLENGDPKRPKTPGRNKKQQSKKHLKEKSNEVSERSNKLKKTKKLTGGVYTPDDGSMVRNGSVDVRT